MDPNDLARCLSQMANDMSSGNFFGAKHGARYVIDKLVEQIYTSDNFEMPGIQGMDKEVCDYVVRCMYRFLFSFRRDSHGNLYFRYDDIYGHLTNARSMVAIHAASTEIPGIVA